MPRYRKRPVVVEAMQFSGSYESGKAILEWADGTVHRDTLITLAIKTLEGDMRVSPEDWVVKGTFGEFYPVKPHVFSETYEPVDESDS